VFAVDSIPAVLAITRDPFVVFTSNVFAILGLRSLYFLLAKMMDRFRHLKDRAGDNPHVCRGQDVPGPLGQGMVRDSRRYPDSIQPGLHFGCAGGSIVFSLASTRHLGEKP